MGNFGHRFSTIRKSMVFLIILSVLALTIVGCSTATPTPTASTAPSPSQIAAPVVTTSEPAVTASQSTVAPSTSKPTVTTSMAANTSKYGGNLRFIQGTPPGAPIGIPWEATGACSFSMQYSLESLVQEQVDGSLKPRLAASWDIVTDLANPSITFHLQKGVKFHDGSDFNAQAVKFNLEKEMDPACVNYGSTTNWKSIEAVDDYTLRVNLKVWQNNQLVTFANAVSDIMSPTAFEKQGIDALRWKMIGTGPFIQTDFQRDVALGFVKNPNYWQQGLPYIDKLQLLYVTDSLTAAALMKSGGADILNCQGIASMANDVQAAGFKIITQPAGTGALINLTPDSVNPDSPWANAKVRIAAEYALDKEAISKAFGMGYTLPAYQMCAPNSKGYDPSLTERKYDPAKAKQLLSEAGYPNGFKTTMICAPFGLTRDLVIAIQAYFKAVGIQVDLQFPQAAQAQQYISGLLPINSLLYNPYMLYANPNQVFRSYYNDPVTSNKSVKRPNGFASLLSATLTSPEVDPVLAKKCEAALYDDCSFIPIGWAISPFATANNVHDSGIGTRGSTTYWESQNVWLSK